MGLHQAVLVVEADQLGVYPCPDRLVYEFERKRVQSALHLGMLVLPHGGLDPSGDVISVRRDGLEQVLLLRLEDSSRVLSCCAVDSVACLCQAPRHRSPTGFCQVHELFSLKEGLSYIGHGALNTGLVLRPPDSARIHLEPTMLRVLQEPYCEPGIVCVGTCDHGLAIVRNHHMEDASKEPPGFLKPLHHGLKGLSVSQPDETVSAVDTGEDQGMELSARTLPIHPAHVPEIDLQLLPWQAVGNSNGRLHLLVAQLLLGKPAQSRIRHVVSGMSQQQLLDLCKAQSLVQPLLKELPVYLAELPTLPVHSRSRRPNKVQQLPE
jgi:hypothetical protein